MEVEKREIKTREDVILLVDTFYSKVKDDVLIGPIFNDVAQIDWAHHLPKMYDFWTTQLIGPATYHGRPFPPHIPLGLEKRHFMRWLSLFSATVDELFIGLGAEMAKQKARNIAAVFQYKLGIWEEQAD